MEYNFEIIETLEQPALSIKTVTSITNLPQEIGKAYSSITAYLSELGEYPKDAPFSAYFNMDMENLDVEMGFPTNKQLEGCGNIISSVIPAGKKATCMYKGAYKDIAPVYEAMTKWMKDNNHIPINVVYEIYYNSPMEVPESELLTKIVFPLK